MPEIEFEVKCNTHNNEDLEATFVNGVLYVDSCETCLADSYEEGREEGINENE